MKIIGLDSNENLYNPYGKINFLKGLSLSEEVFQYPDNEYVELRGKYANYCNVKLENIIAGNGSDEMLNLIISNYIFKDDVLMTFGPDFGMYDFYVRQNDGAIHKYVFDKNKFDVDEFISEIKRISPKVVMFSNPNNPTGNALGKDTIKKILDNITDIKIVIDEAYFEFFGESVIDEIDNYSNLIVTRTLSKAFGLASLRVGFLIANVDQVRELNSKKVPFNINRFSNYVAIKALEKPDLMKKSVNKIIEGRTMLFEKLKLIEKEFSDIKFYQSKSNYIYFEGDSTEEIRLSLMKTGIRIRSFSESKGRITVGTMENNRQVIECMYSLIRGEEFERN
ncbi:MAG: pyridoxal phosphate-dependent aminotransferase [Sarcina sp.]